MRRLDLGIVGRLGENVKREASENESGHTEDKEKFHVFGDFAFYV